MNFWKAERTVYPPLFRILLGTILLIDAVFSISVNGFIFDANFNALYHQNSVLNFFRENHIVFQSIYIIFLLLFLIGIGGFWVKGIVFLFSVAFDLLEPTALTWGDLILGFTLLYFIFADSSQHLSAGKKHRKSDLEKWIAKLAVFSIILNLFLVYVSNGYSKLTDSTWQEGYAVYFAFAQFQNFENSFFHLLLKNEWISQLTSYFIILIQFLFPVWVMIRKTRIPIILIGIVLHLIMLWQFGLWKFELIVILLYGFLLNDEEWRRILPRKFQKKYFS